MASSRKGVCTSPPSKVKSLDSFGSRYSVRLSSETKSALNAAYAKRRAAKRKTSKAPADGSKRSDFNIRKLLEIARKEGLRNVSGIDESVTGAYGIVFEEGPIHTLMSLEFEPSKDPASQSGWRIHCTIKIPAEKKMPFYMSLGGVHPTSEVPKLMRLVSSEVHTANILNSRRIEAENKAKKPSSRETEPFVYKVYAKPPGKK